MNTAEALTAALLAEHGAWQRLLTLHATVELITATGEPTRGVRFAGRPGVLTVRGEPVDMVTHLGDLTKELAAYVSTVAQLGIAWHAATQYPAG